MTPSQQNKVQLWLERFRQFDSSSLTIAQFCRSVGCSVPSFYQWRRKLRGLPTSAKSSDIDSTGQHNQRSQHSQRSQHNQHSQFGQLAQRCPEPTPPTSSFLQVSTDSGLAISIQHPSGVVISVPIEAIHSLTNILKQVA